MSTAAETVRPTVCLRFRFPDHPKIRARVEACPDIQRQAVDDTLENGQIAAFTLMKVLPWALRIRISA